MRYLSSLFSTILTLALVGACSHSSQQGGDYDIERYPYIKRGHVEDTYADPRTMPTPLGSCEELLAATPPDSETWSLASTREVQLRVLPFNEVYDRQRIHAALTETLDFQTLIPGEDEVSDKRIYVRVPKGFVTDLTSVPPGFAQSFHRTYGKTSIPAIVHDFLYAIGAPGNKAQRFLADTTLRRAMSDNGSRTYSRRSVYFIVRNFGKDSYGGDRELRFLDEHAFIPPRSNPYDRDRQTRAQIRIVIPNQEFSRDEHDRRTGGADRLRGMYVKECAVPRTPRPRVRPR